MDPGDPDLDMRRLERAARVLRCPRQWRRAGAWRGRRGRRCVGGPLRFCIGAQAAAGEIKEETLDNITVTVQNCTRLYTVMLGGLYTVMSAP